MRRFFRFSLPAIFAMAWRNRDEVLEWAGFAVRAARAAVPGGEGMDDVRTEARVRWVLARDRRTRRADGLHVEVRDGVAVLTGVVAADVLGVAPELAQDVPGVRSVDNRLRLPRRAQRKADRAAAREQRTVDAVSHER